MAPRRRFPGGARGGQARPAWRCRGRKARHRVRDGTRLRPRRGAADRAPPRRRLARTFLWPGGCLPARGRDRQGAAPVKHDRRDLGGTADLGPALGWHDMLGAGTGRQHVLVETRQLSHHPGRLLPPGRRGPRRVRRPAGPPRRPPPVIRPRAERTDQRQERTHVAAGSTCSVPRMAHVFTSVRSSHIARGTSSRRRVAWRTAIASAAADAAWARTPAGRRTTSVAVSTPVYSSNRRRTRQASACSQVTLVIPTACRTAGRVIGPRWE